MSRALPEDWPAIYVEAKCETCGEGLFSELFRPGVEERYHQKTAMPGRMGVAAFWLRIMQDHVAQHRQTGGSSSELGPERGQVSEPFAIAAGPGQPKKNKTGG